MSNRQLKPTLTIYAPNARGTGSAIKMSVIPANEDNEGYYTFRFARQKSSTEMDWENAREVQIGFTEICLMLQVFRGETESINDGKGVVTKSGTRLRMMHKLEPKNGYYLADDCGEDRREFFFTTSVSLGVFLAIEQTMSLIAFGIVGNEENA